MNTPKSVIREGTSKKYSAPNHSKYRMSPKKNPAQTTSFRGACAGFSLSVARCGASPIRILVLRSVEEDRLRVEALALRVEDVEA